jgi:hypothetical protein
VSADYAAAESYVVAVEPIVVGEWLLYQNISAHLPWSSGALLLHHGHPLAAEKIAVYATHVSWRIQGLVELEMNRPLGRIVAAPRGSPNPWRFPGAPEGCLLITQTSCFHMPAIDHVVCATSECDSDVISIGSRHPLIFVNVNGLPVHPHRPNTGWFSLWVRVLE